LGDLGLLRIGEIKGPEMMVSPGWPTVTDAIGFAALALNPSWCVLSRLVD